MILPNVTLIVYTYNVSRKKFNSEINDFKEFLMDFLVEKSSCVLII